jgi:hypothetical protein
MCSEQIAAAVSENGKLGVCGPVESGDAKTYIDGLKMVRRKPVQKSALHILPHSRMFL